MGVVKLGDVARESRLKWTKSKQDVPIVGLEHLIPDEIRFDAYDINTDNTFSKRFVKGQVLFGRRRAYQRKAAIAEFDGICSGDITVIEAIEGKMVPELLPFIIQTPVFFDYANRGSAGSLSPRVKWEHLADYEFELPPLEEQKILADKLWAAYRLKEAYKKLLDATDEMVKSQFIEMVGDPRNNPKGWPTKRLSELAEYSIGLTYKPEQICDDGTIVLRSGNIQDGKISFSDIVRVNAPIKESLFVKEDDILMCSRNGSASLVGKVAMIPDINEPMTFGAFMTIIRSAEAKYLYLYFQSQDFRERVSEGKSSTMNQITQKMLDKVEVPFPDKDVRETLSAIASQADKSKFGDFKSQFIEMFGNPLSSKQKNELKRLGQCCIINPRRPNIALCDTDKVSFIPMPAVSEDGYLVDMADEEYGKVKKGFTYFENNDVLFAKITPCMENGKGAIAYGLTNGIGVGSTEFHVLRPINGISSPYWLLTLTRMPIFRERAAKNMSGTGGQKRVSASYLNHFMVGLPAIEEQRRFEAIYRQADKSKFGDFKTQFIEMFGTVENNTHNFPIMTIGEFANCFAGATPSTSHPEYWENGRIRWMSSGEVHKGHVEDTDSRITELGYKSASTRMVPIHSIVIAIAGQGKTRGTVAITEVDLCTNQSLCAIVPDERVNYSYLYHNLQGRYLELRGLSGDVNGRGGLNLKIIQKIPVILPPIEKQQQFASIAQQADKSKFELRKSIDAIDKVIKSLINN